jgi:hypothetical protein
VNDTPKIESVAPRKLVRFVDLMARGIVRSWPTLLSWIKREGPPGFMLAPQTRAWDGAGNNSRAKQPTPHQAENPIEEDELDYFPICARGRR